MIDADVAKLYIDFVVERHKVYEARLVGAPQPWTEDPVLARRKFTNVFRVLDPGTQYVLNTLLEPEGTERDNLMRMFLYRYTGVIKAWDYLDVMFGMPTVMDLEEVRQHFRTYRGGAPAATKGRWSGEPTTQHKSERPIFTGAYVVSPLGNTKGSDKLDSVINYAKRLFDPSSPDDIMRNWRACCLNSSRFDVLRSQHGTGDFMAMQILTDWGYTPFCGEDLEDTFVVAGPGCRKGAALINPTAKATEVIAWAQATLWTHPECPMLGDRPPSLMDVQNTLCEFSKYHRYLGTKPIGLYSPAHPGVQPDPTIPTHWS